MTQNVAQLGDSLIQTVGLDTSPIAVWLQQKADAPAHAERLTRHRYCQAIMKARHGAHVVLDAEGIACPAAAAAFGFSPLPEGLRSGKGLVGFGIVADAEVGKRMFSGMTTLEPGLINQLYLCPLQQASCLPDIVVVEDDVEKLMWVALAYLHARRGERIQSSTAVLQATCVDSTIIPYVEGRLNLGYGCYGCREATDLGTGEAILGFPGKDLPNVIEHLEFLVRRAIPASRSKGVWAALKD